MNNTPPADSLVRIEHLSHRYTGAWAIRDINMEITRNGVIGLLGSNGAGKSTTMNILCGALNQTEGDVFINGISMRAEPQRAKREIGFLPQDPPLYLDLTVDEYLRYCAALRLMPDDTIPAAVTEAKKRCGIERHGERLLRNLSGGFRQRVGIAQAIIHSPRVVVLDEPTNGLDPNQVVEVRALIRDIGRERVVIFSSHILSEVQVLCREIRMIESGRIVFADTMDAFNNYVQPHSLQVQLENPPEAAQFLAISGITRADFLTSQRVRLSFTGEQDVAERVIEASVRGGWKLREISFEKSAVDEVFKQLSAGASR